MGQRQRVLLIRELVFNPKMLLLDEPTSNLDHETGMKVMSYLLEINNNEGTTILMATHDRRLEKIAPEIYFLKNGKLSRE